MQNEQVRMEVLGLSSDVVVIVLVLAGWFVLMRFVLPRLGIST
jgi:p-aminobenzoyl-glutamate transporter AbgT